MLSHLGSNAINVFPELLANANAVLRFVVTSGYIEDPETRNAIPLTRTITVSAILKPKGIKVQEYGTASEDQEKFVGFLVNPKILPAEIPSDAPAQLEFFNGSTTGTFILEEASQNPFQVEQYMGQKISGILRRDL